MKIKTASAESLKLRICVFGAESVGKSHFAMHGPQPLPFDIEGRIDAFVGELGPFPCIDFDENHIVRDFVEAARTARQGFDGCGTFVLESWTELERHFERSVGIDPMLGSSANRGTRAFDLHDIRKKIETEILVPALAGPTKCHIVVTAHEKNLWGKAEGGSGIATVGFVPDATRNFAHYFDLVLHMQRDRKTGRRFSVVTKSNYASFLPIGKVIDDFGWNDLAPILRGTVPTDSVTMAQLVGLHERAGKPHDTLGKWLVSAGFPITPAAPKLAPVDALRARSMLHDLIARRQAA